MNREVLEKLDQALAEEEQFWFEFPKEDLDKVGREADERFRRYLAKINKAA